MQVDKPGVYPLETRECPGCGDRRHSKYRCRHNANCDRYDAHPGPHRLCSTCHGTGRIPDENGPQVEIQYDAIGNSDLEGPGYYWCTELEYSGPFATPAEAFADAQRAHKANTAG